MKNKQLGYKFEKIASNYLKNKGYNIIGKNFTIRGGEIDIICEKDGVIVFVEVKGVSASVDFQDYISKNKQKALQKTAETWISNFDSDNIKEYRFDLILIENSKLIEHIENFLY